MTTFPCMLLCPIIMLFFVAPLAAALLTYAFFWYETANGPHRALLEERYGNRLRRTLLGGILSSFVSSILTILAFPLGFMQKERGPSIEPATPEPHIILIHGLYHNASAWILLRRRLVRAGFSRVTIVGYPSLKHTFWELVQKIDKQIERLADSEREPLILVGHSLGGLLAEAYVGKPGRRTTIAGMITLGTPHKGSKLAVLGLGRLARGIVFHGPVIQELRQRPSTPDVPRVALYSPIDNMVLPNEALKAEDPGWAHVETEPISHVAMLYHKGTAELVIDHVRRIWQAGRREEASSFEFTR